jgi:Fe-S cluster biogenesis protein NfuA
MRVEGRKTNGGEAVSTEQVDPAGEFVQQVTAALDKVRPDLQADGGDIELVAIEGQNARVRLKGACHG